MEGGEVSELFKALLDKLNDLLLSIRNDAMHIIQEGNYAKAQEYIILAQQVERFIAEMHVKYQEWQMLSNKPMLHQKSTALTKNEPYERINNITSQVKYKLPRGLRTPEQAYRIPILKALVELGGEAPMQEVLKKVYEQMKTILKPVDLEPLPSDPKKTPRWKNTAMWERFNMVRDGLLRGDSPRGIWAITERGREYLYYHKEYSQ